ncbi:hypothetical protein L5515_002247 [Caenorhabditis briggsae]|uniref:S phase cyclin A-associated protein in the endoplasmic reticulum N-terminal domain-containing protein n=3 Tax=Caenorhabditis briggsae TaxID=6238 RepID=A0AAE9E586_CAEBR|nr:hypothetical protein L5515_002247 [Caenorhabditis briggsae]
MNPADREKAESIVSRSSKKKKNRKKRARQWTGYVENLKTTIDLMYEMCRSEQSVAGCREAMLYLQSSSNDFKSLIETINVEKQWDQDENNPQETIKRPSVAWEVRKSMSSPNANALPISTIIAEAVKNVSPTSPNQKSSEPTASSQSNLTYARITAAAAVAAVAVSSSTAPEDGWKLVTSRRRKSTSSTTVSEFDREFSVEKETELPAKSQSSEPLNVYERLSSTSYRRGPPTTNRTLTCPKSAMDLPQTRASMAKMAYSRQLLWEKNQQVLVEKLRQKQKKEKRGTSGQTGGQCGFTFADPMAVRKSVEAFNQQKIGGRRGGKETPSPSSANAELQSINEESNPPNAPSSENSEDVVPADPTPSSSASQPTQSRNGSLFGYVALPEELEKDDEWREMTEEEESLALEENSLNLEIKQAESMEIDAELERQVEMEAASLEREQKRKTQRKQKEEMENFFKVFEEIRNSAWSELMEQESVATYHQKSTQKSIHEPGTPVERHEKMSSPSRRRCQKDDDDFGKRHEMKQKHAEELRQQLQDAKTFKLKELTTRREEVRAKQEAIREQKRQFLEARMQRASDNRDKNIMEVIRKAKDDDQRVMEVKFIATLQEENKQYELRVKDAKEEEKLKQLADERAKKHEEKAQKKREQEAAAVKRRKHAQEVRQTKIRELAGEKAPEDMLEYLNSLVASPEEPTEAPAFLWPSSAPSDRPRECALCPSTVIRSDLEAVAHVVCTKEHSLQAKMISSGSQVEELKRHLFGVFKEVGDTVEAEKKEQEESRRKDEQSMKAREILEKIQIAETLPGPLASPRNRTKFVREFNMAIDKFCSSKFDEKLQENVEKSLHDLVQAVESDQKHQESCLNLDQFCALQGPQKMIDLLLDWTKNGISMRLCIRICHSLCIFLKDPRVAYAVIFKPELLKIVDKVMELIWNFSDSTKTPQLSGLLDILGTCLKSASLWISQTPQKHQVKLHRELLALNASIAETMQALGALFQGSLASEDLKNALSGCKAPGLLATRLLGFAEHTSPEFLEQVSTAILKYTYDVKSFSEHLERSENSEKAGTSQKVTDHLVSMVISTYSVNPRILKACFSKSSGPQNLVMMVVLLEDSLWKCAQNIRSQGHVEERPWGALTKDEEALCKLSQHLGAIVDQMEQWQKRTTMISWTTGHSACLHILLHKIPIRLLSIGKHAKRIVPTVAEKIMDRLTNSEKSEMMADTSADWIFENSLFPGRQN